MKCVKFILVLLSLQAFSSAANELYADDTSFSLVLRTTLDNAYSDSQFMSIGWSEKSSKIPAPPAPPGNNFYAYIDGYLFKEIREFSVDKVQKWDFYFTLPANQSVRKLFTNTAVIVSKTDYAVVLDGNGNLRYDLHTDSEINLDESFQGHFSIVAIPKNPETPPQLAPTFSNKISVDNTTTSSFKIDLKNIFIKSNEITDFVVDTFNNLSIEYSISNEKILTVSSSKKFSELRLRVYASNKYGQSFTDIFLQSDVLTNVEEDVIPSKVSLNQNYPNPFNPNTTIAFELNEATKVKLSVFTMNGVEIATIIDANISAGKHLVPFNAINLPSGVYIYRLQTNEQVLKRKMTLLK